MFDIGSFLLGILASLIAGIPFVYVTRHQGKKSEEKRAKEKEHDELARTIEEIKLIGKESGIVTIENGYLDRLKLFNQCNSQQQQLHVKIEKYLDLPEFKVFTEEYVKEIDKIMPHCIGPLSIQSPDHSKYVHSYCSVNRKFKDKIVDALDRLLKSNKE